MFGSKKSSDAAKPARSGLYGRLSGALKRTRESLFGGIAELVGKGQAVGPELIEEIEMQLLSADVGVAATERLIKGLDTRQRRGELAHSEGVFDALSEDMLAILEPCSIPLAPPSGMDRPFVLLVVGVNGAGKTTTIGKLAARWRAEGRSVLLAAGDTFRAAAVEQLQAWGERTGVPVIAQHSGADSASVVFDAVNAATARKVDIIIADTAGRLHTQGGLMDELRKVHRVVGKVDASAPHETLLVLDAGTGQNALAQAAQFRDAVQVSGLVLTKLDGTARGGVVLAIAEQFGLPIRFIGVGESVEDLRPFNASDFVDGLLGRDASS